MIEHGGKFRLMNGHGSRNFGKFRSGFAARLFRARAHTVPAASCFACVRCRDRSDQGGRYVLIVNKDNVVEQRKVEPGQLIGELRVIEKGLTKDYRVVIGGIMRAIPGQKVEPELGTLAAANQ